jgi:hypothetical protein
MKFQPKTDKEISEEKLLPEGVYDFEISQGLDKVSKIKPDGSGGNEMIELLVRVYKPDGNFTLITDYLMEKIAYKLKHATDACGLQVAYDTGTLHGDNFVGKTGKCKVKIQKDKTGDYPDKNVIADYVVDKDKETDSVKPKPLNESAPVDADMDDSIPF